MLSVDLDTTTGLINVMSRDLLTVEEVYEFEAKLTEACRKSRMIFGRARILVDGTDATVQTQEVMNAFLELETFVTGAQDRHALVLPSALARMQAARSLHNERERAFPSKEEALAWLLEGP